MNHEPTESPEGRSNSAAGSSGRTAATLLVVLVGLVLRAIPIPWGTIFVHDAQVALHPDEPKIVRFADRFPDSVETNNDYRYPLLVHDVVGALWSAALAVHPIPPDEVPVAGEPRFDRATVFGRTVFVLLFGLGGMALLALFTVRLGARGAVPWVLAAFSAQPFVVANTALVQTDVPLAFMLFALLVVLLGIERRGAWRPVRDPLVLGLLLGLTVATKYTGLVGLLPVAAVVGLGLARRWLGWAAALGGAALFFAAAAVAFVGAVPGAVFDFENFRKSLEYEFTSKSELAEFDLATFVDHFTLAAPVWLLVAAALGLVLSPRARRSVVVYSALVTFAIYVFLVREKYAPDWTMPLMPLIAVLSGLFLHGIATRIGIVVPAVLVLAGWGVSAATVYARYAGDTRYRFDEWVHENVAPPGPIGEAPAPTRRSWASPSEPAGYTFTGVADLPEYIVMSEREFDPVKRVHVDPNEFARFGAPFDVEQKRLAALGPDDIDFYRDLLRHDEDFAWTPPEGYAPRWDYELVKRFVPGRWALDMAGLEIRVYRRR